MFERVRTADLPLPPRPLIVRRNEEDIRDLPMTANQNRQIVMKQRPVGLPQESDFELITTPMPDPGEGEVLLRALYVSVDPGMRMRMNEGMSYTAAAQPGEVMGLAAVGEVVRSNAPAFAPGEFAMGVLRWQEYGVADAAVLQKIDPADAPLSTALGVLGLPGYTAYFGLLDIGQPKAGEVVVVSAAAGAVGAVTGQIAKIKGCRVVGTVGSDEKVRHITEDLGFDAAINYKSAGDLDAALAAACPDGIDIYFDNVGGPLTDAVIDHLALGARVVICGQIAVYNDTDPAQGPRIFWPLITKRASIEGFIVFDYAERYAEAHAQLLAWVKDSALKYREDVLDGFEALPRAFIRMMKGENVGKQLVRIAEAAS